MKPTATHSKATTLDIAIPGLAALALAISTVCMARPDADGQRAASAKPTQQSTLRAAVDADGTVHVDGLTLPPSRYSSAEAKADLINRAKAPPAPTLSSDIKVLREFFGKYNDALAERMKQLYSVRIDHKIIGGVRTEVIVPTQGVSERNTQRVLINLHGGGFQWGEGSGGEVESVPIASVGRIKVITVAYRLGPEHRFPAASEDVAAVYKALLRDYDPAHIGIYGCSAGGILTAQSIAWFDKVGLPMPGAIGTFCGSASPFSGDSIHIATALSGESRAELQEMTWRYFAGARATDPLVFPVNSPQLLARFPPTLLMAGSRDFALSSLFNTQAQLEQAGVETNLHVWDGLRHAFFIDPDVPESKQAYEIIVRFFDRHLKTGPK